MPEIARFFGVIIRMFTESSHQHHRPHFHAYYQDHTVTIAVDSIETLAGSFPSRQRRLVEAWAELHQEELLQDWALLQAGLPPRKIEPLK